MFEISEQVQRNLIREDGMQTTMVPLDEGQAFRIEKRVTVVGRKKFVCDMYLPDRRISQLHCVIRQTNDGDLVLRDLGSTNGTRINGKKITEGLLVPGDELTFAAAKFRIEVRESDGNGDDSNPRAEETIPYQPLGEQPSSPVQSTEVPVAISEREKSLHLRQQKIAESKDLKSKSGQGRSHKSNRVENVEDATKSDSHAAVNTLRAETESDYEEFFLDDQLSAEEEGEQTEIIKASEASREVIEDWPQFPGQFTMVDSSPYDCPSCQGVKMVRAPFSWWQAPLRLLKFGLFCCPRCFRRCIR